MAPEFKNDWQDFSWFCDTFLPKQRIAELREFGRIIEEQTRTTLHIRSQERKADLLRKVENAFRAMHQTNDMRTYSKVRYDCESVGLAVRQYLYQPPAIPTFGGISAGSTSHYGQPPPPPHRYGSTSNYGNYHAPPPPASSSSSWNASNVYNRGVATLLDWKTSPMWKPIKALTNMEPLPDIAASENSHVRREKKAHFTIPADVLQKLDFSKANPASHPHYSVRIFCASSDYYRPPGHPQNMSNSHITNRSIPIEYPFNPDVIVDELGVPFKERGLRGKAGSAPPLDVEKSRPLTRSPGRMISVVFGHTGPTVGKKKDQSKRFWFQVVFAEMTNKEELLTRLLDMTPTSDNQTSSVKPDDDDEDDIIFTNSKMSLKDPLSMMRITRPIRSSKCSHMQCFDATWWIENNAVHPQWLCPLCSKALAFDELIVDGYFLNILKAVPDTVEEVVVEPDGQWHTEDGKFGSANWLARRPALIASEATLETPPVDRKPSISPTPRNEPACDGHKRKFIDLLSDSEDEDERPLANDRGANGSHRSQPAMASSSARERTPAPPLPMNVKEAAVNEVIDLTLDSDTDDDDDMPGFHRPGPAYSPPPAGGSSGPPMGAAARLNGGYHKDLPPPAPGAYDYTPRTPGADTESLDFESRWRGNSHRHEQRPASYWTPPRDIAPWGTTPANDKHGYEGRAMNGHPDTFQHRSTSDWTEEQQPRNGLTVYRQY